MFFSQNGVVVIAAAELAVTRKASNSRMANSDKKQPTTAKLLAAVGCDGCTVGEQNTRSEMLLERPGVSGAGLLCLGSGTLSGRVY